MIELLFFVSIVLAIVSLENKNILHSVIFLGLLGLCLGVIYYLMGSSLIALFKFSIAASSAMVVGYLVFSIKGGKGK